MYGPFPPFDPDGEEENSSTGHVRLRDIPLRTIFPNLLTLLAICSGLTAMRFATEGRIELAVAAIIFAGFLDGIDGRVARFLKSTTRFGAQMDSLADFVNFGVAPAMVLYFTILSNVPSLGWVVVLLYASSACLRLARFNVMLENKDAPDWHANYFVGVPAPAGALITLLPVYLILKGVEVTSTFAWISCAFTLLCAYLMVSSIPTFSGKKIAVSVRRDLVLPLMIMAVFTAAIVLSYPWYMLSGIAIVYLASIPFSYMRWNKLDREETAE